METDTEITILKYHARIFEGIICIWICYAQASTIINRVGLALHQSVQMNTLCKNGIKILMFFGPPKDKWMEN